MKRRNAILFFLFLPAIADIPLSARSQNVEAVPPNPFGTRSVVNQDAVRDGLTRDEQPEEPKPEVELLMAAVGDDDL